MAADQLYLIFRTDGTLRHASRGWTNRFGSLPANDLNGYNIFHDRQALASGLSIAFQRVVLGEEVPSLDHALRIEQGSQAGRKFWLRARLTAIVDGRNRLHSVAVFFEDFTPLKESAESWQLLLDTANAALLVTRDGKIRFCNPGAQRLTGQDLASLEGRALLDLLHPEDRPMLEERHQQLFLAGDLSPDLYTARFLHKDGPSHWLRVSVIPFAWEGLPAQLHFLHAAGPETVQGEQLAPLRHMELIERFAGGVAEDFNNILSGILCFADICAGQTEPGSAICDNIRAIKEAAERGATLTRQMLAFSHKQGRQLQVTDLNAAVEMSSGMLARLIGETVRLDLDLGDEPPPVVADPSQIEQVLVNLAVNARDAMTEGGRLTIRTGKREITANDPHAPHARPGTYAWLSVSDTGKGIPTELHERVFEPFFTTKHEGRGSGLGLATVYGIVKQRRGYVYLRSEAGRGATFDIYLPAADSQPAPHRPQEHMPGPSGNETILVVDDDPLVRDVIRTILSQLGYTVLLAANGNEARAISGRYQGGIDLLLADLALPTMGGSELADQLAKERPELRVLFMSGHPEPPDADARRAANRPASFLAKPLTPSVLSHKVRAILER